MFHDVTIDGCFEVTGENLKTLLLYTIIALRKTNFHFQENSSNTRVKKLIFFKLFETGGNCCESLNVLQISPVTEESGRLKRKSN